jgi:hypothetical protein
LEVALIAPSSRNAFIDHLSDLERHAAATDSATEVRGWGLSTANRSRRDLQGGRGSEAKEYLALVTSLHARVHHVFLTMGLALDRTHVTDDASCEPLGQAGGTAA